jgi:hypothetical protein
MKTGNVASLVSKNAGTKNRLLNIPKANIKGVSCGCDSLLNIGPKMNSLISKR